MKSKKGSDKIISVYWFLILAIIAGGVIIMVNVFYNSPYDVRQVESEILAMKVANCIEVGGEMSELLDGYSTLRDSFRDNFRDICNLNFDPGEKFEHEQYYVLVDFYLPNSEEPDFQISEGNSNWVADCGIEAKKEKLVECTNKKFFTSLEGGNVYRVEILTIVRNTEKNVA
jgi:hypothetical protein